MSELQVLVRRTEKAFTGFTLDLREETEMWSVASGINNCGSTSPLFKQFFLHKEAENYTHMLELLTFFKW